VMRLDGDRLVPFLDGPQVYRRQDKPLVFARNGPAVVATRVDVVRRGSLYGDDSRPLVMTPDESLDVDGESDLERLEYLLIRRR